MIGGRPAAKSHADAAYEQGRRQGPPASHMPALPNQTPPLPQPPVVGGGRPAQDRALGRSISSTSESATAVSGVIVNRHASAEAGRGTTDRGYPPPGSVGQGPPVITAGAHDATIAKPVGAIGDKTAIADIPQHRAPPAMPPRPQSRPHMRPLAPMSGPPMTPPASVGPERQAQIQRQIQGQIQGKPQRKTMIAGVPKRVPPVGSAQAHVATIAPSAPPSASHAAPAAASAAPAAPHGDTAMPRATAASSSITPISAAAPVTGSQVDSQMAPNTGDLAPEKGRSALPEPGARINQYEIIRELGRGGMGAVYLARDTKLGRRVAIKFLQSEQPEFTERFTIEARATARCSHENIVIIYEVGEHGGNPFMVLEFLQGAPLGKHIIDGQPMSPSRAVEIMVPVVRALAVAHDQDIVHRDLKPDNIFLTDNGTVKVLDFGIAKVVQQRGGQDAGPAPLSAAAAAARQLGHTGTHDAISGGELTHLGALIGTMPYMSPEQWMGDGVDHRTDIWAVGILLFKMVVGKHPLYPMRGAQLMATAMLDQPMPRVRDMAPEVPEALADVIDRCLLKYKNQRYGTARQLLEGLEALLPGRYGGRRMIRTDRSPYAGLSAFQENDADRFFGRSNEIAALVTRLRDQPLVGVVGPSGVGKSSFVRAGLVPALKQSGEPWETMVVRPGRNPLSALATVLAPMVSTTNTGAISVGGNSDAVSGARSGSRSGSGLGTGRTGGTGEPSVPSSSVAEDISLIQAVTQRLSEEPGFLGTVLRSRARRYGRKILLFIDQFEELYTMIPDRDARMVFTACLAGVADDATTPLRVVLSVRSDFLDRAAEDQRFMGELSQGLFFLLPPNRDGLRDALVQPAEMAGYRFESERMVTHMLDSLAATSGALPLLQFTAAKLWELRDSKRHVLSEQSYGVIGGVQGALAAHAEEVMSELGPQNHALVRAIFLRLVSPERTRALASVAELRELMPNAGDLQRLIDHLVQARLLVIQTGAGASDAGAMVEIVHESLIHTWPQLRRWLDENQDDAAFLDQLRTAAQQWHSKGRPAGLLWRGDTAEEANRWYRRYRGELPDLQREYVEAVLAMGARSARRRRFLLVASMVGLVGLTAAATVGMLVIADAQQEAEAQAVAALAAEQKVTEQYQDLEVAMESQREAERQARAAAEEAQAANNEAQASRAELASANDSLEFALDEAKEATKRARREREKAERNEESARRSEEKALRANRRIEELLARERERVRRLEEQLGSKLIEDLK